MKLFFMDVELRQLPSYRRFWRSQVLSFMANQILIMAFGWHIYALTHSALSLGYIGLVLFMPQLLLMLVVGQVADRYNRRRIVLTTQSLEFILSLILAIGSYTQQLTSEWIFACAFAVGTVRAFQGPAMQAMLPALIPLPLLPKAVSLSSASRQFATIAGPALGGLLFWGGSETVYASSALFFLLAALSMFRIQLPPDTRVREPVTRKTLLAGINFIRHRPVILGAISLDLFSVLLGGATALLPIYADTILHTGTLGLGLLRAAPAIGALAIALYLARRPIEEKIGKAMFAGVIGFGITTIIFAVSTSFWLSFGSLIVMGAADMVSVVIRSSLVQLETPHEMRGRVGAVNSIFIGASNQLGEFESGVTAAWVGVVPSVVLGGIGTLAIVAIWIKLFPELYHRNKLINDVDEINQAPKVLPSSI